MAFLSLFSVGAGLVGQSFAEAKGLTPSSQAVKSNISKVDALVDSNIEQYFESVYSKSDKLLNCSDQTKAKLKQTLMKILADAGLVTKQGSDFPITTPIISERTRSAILADGGDYYIKALGGTC